MQKQKTKIQKQYEYILKTPQSKIDFYYFVAIHDYIEIIDKDDELRKAVFRHEDLEWSNPYNLLIERGRDVADLNRVFRDKKVSSFFGGLFKFVCG